MLATPRLGRLWPAAGDYAWMRYVRLQEGFCREIVLARLIKILRLIHLGT